MPDYLRRNQKNTYADAGVDIDAGNELVRRIAPLAKATSRAGADSTLGGFGGVFDLKACGYNDPLLVAGNDGVGTKVKIAIEAGIHNRVGIDLVAMCVNDLIVQGAEPLFFLDYYATGKLDVEVGAQIIAGIAEGCKQAACALIGGETAEMPGLYAGDDYDLAGFCVGAVERGKLLPAPTITSGDIILGLAASGPHSNGYSLIRRLVAQENIGWDEIAPFASDKTLAQALLEPTRIYVKSLLPLCQAGEVKALAHITGGGITENLPRILPDGKAAEIHISRLSMPDVFHWLQAIGNIDADEMRRVFNCGIGMTVVVAPENLDSVQQSLQQAGETVFELGAIIDDAAQPVIYR